MDLAIACAYLWKSGQVPLPVTPLEQICIYGELSLEGHIQLPDDFEDLDDLAEGYVHFILPTSGGLSVELVGGQ